MKPSIALKMLTFSLTALSAGILAAAAEERPRLQDYPSSYAFLQALETWNRAHPNGVASKSAPVKQPEPQQVVADPTSEQAPPPFEVTGPESLDTAVEKARDIAHPTYKEKVRYHRSTHLSFPLNSIDGQDMSQASVGDTLSLKGKTEAEKKEELETLTLKIQQDQLNSQQKVAADGTVPPPAQTAPLTSEMLSSRNRSTISVTSH